MGRRLTQEEYINRCNHIHNHKYDYTNTVYTNKRSKVKITCPVHGEFKQLANNHLVGRGCQKCDHDNRKMSLADFITRANKKHNLKYDYSMTSYSNIRTSVEISCPKHGIFIQVPNDHLKGSGCPICRESKGESEISKILKSLKVAFVRQKRFEYCKNISQLPFDFYIPEWNICIEYDGIQHFKPIDWFGSEQYLKKVQKHDRIKTSFCNDNSIKLIRYSYFEDLRSISNSLHKLNESFRSSTDL